MKKLFKRTMSCVMAVAIMASMSINAFANDSKEMGDSDKNFYLEMVYQQLEPVEAAEVEDEIQKKMSEIRGSVYEQLKAQNAERLLSAYESILYPDVVMSVMEKHGVTLTNSRAGGKKYFAPNGGVVAGTTPIGVEGYSDMEVVKVGMTKDDAKEWLIRNQGKYINVGDILSTIAATALNKFSFFADLFDIAGYISDSTIDKIEACGWSVLVVNTHDTEYDLYASAYVAWEDYSYITVPDGSYSFQRF